VPTACLAAILVYTGVKLLNVGALRNLHRYGTAVMAVAIITTVMIVVSSLLTGIVVGLVLSLLQLLHAISKLKVRVNKDPVSDRIDVLFEGSAIFVNLPRFIDTLDEIPETGEVHVHIRGLNYIDHAAIEALQNWEKVRVSRGAQVYVAWDEFMNLYQSTNTVPALR